MDKLKITRGAFGLGIEVFHCKIVFKNFLQGSVSCREILGIHMEADNRWSQEYFLVVSL